jgi:ABC-type bacteriocin/lantibiotic exporter with double-glycine peptidase domain
MKFLLFFALALGLMAMIGLAFKLIIMGILILFEIPKEILRKRREKKIRENLKNDISEIVGMMRKVAEIKSQNIAYKSAIKDNDKTIEFCKKKKKTTKK